MKSLLFLLVALTCLLISSTTVVACQCDQYDVPVCAAFWKAQAVFVGQLRDITPPDPKSTDRTHVATLHFIVEQLFRGITSEHDTSKQCDKDCRYRRRQAGEPHLACWTSVESENSLRESGLEG